MADENAGRRHPERALSAAKIRSAKPGKYANGNGLSLVVDKTGARRWVLRAMIQGGRRELGLGRLSLYTTLVRPIRSVTHGLRIRDRVFPLDLK